MWGRGKRDAEPTAEKVEGKAAPSLAELLKRLVDDTGRLFRSELRLAQAELTASVGKALPALGLVMAGGLLLTAALFILLGALVAWLTPLVGLGWAAFIVAVGAGAAGAALALTGKKQLAGIGFLPTRVAKALRDDAEALKGQEP